MYYRLAEVDKALDILGFGLFSFGESLARVALCRPVPVPPTLLVEDALEVAPLDVPEDAPVALLDISFRSLILISQHLKHKNKPFYK
jgi:hypothetical protein